MTYILDLPIEITRLPMVILLLMVYIFFAHTMSFLMSCFCFFMTRAHSLTVAKNVMLWVLAGEIFPLDLIPEPYAKWVILSPFASGAYIPVGYLTGRLGDQALLTAFGSLGVSLVVIGGLSAFFWRIGVARYVGTGA